MRALFLLALACAAAAAVLVAGELSPSEQAFVDATSAAGAREHLAYYTSLDHVAGTPGDWATVQYTQAAFEGFGLATEVLPFKVLLNYPLSRSLEMTAPVPFVASLAEDVVPEDPTSDNRWRNMTFHGYGADGDVEAELVYVNYGAASDFELLQSRGIDLKGKIAVARYGRVFRGLKVQNAQAFGCVACIIFSDPSDDGFTQGTTYPEGPWRPESGVQRGSVQFLSRCSGDPGMVERDPNVCGYDTKDLIPAIPSLPISYRDVLPLLQNMGGPAPPAGWTGGLNATYALGPGPAKVRMVVRHSYEKTTLWNVVATIPGAHADPAVAQQQVILGNHRDAWVFGSTDPNSGTAALLEIARGLGSLLATGWRPARTIKLASWDGEEYGLLGSVNYAESHAAELAQFGVAYLNVDVAVTGRDLYAAATPSLINLIVDATKDITDPATRTSLWAQWAKQPTGVFVDVLGSGSDFASFLHHLGVASLDMAFNGPYGVYHSVYDSFYWTTHFGDPTFAYHRAMAQLWGVLGMRLAGARVLPFALPSYAAALGSYLSRAQAAAASANLTDLDFTALADAVADFQPPCAVLECYRQFVGANQSLPESEVAALNTNLANLESGFIINADDGFVGNGLPGRPWYKHVVQAPGLQTGYDANVFPSLWDAIDLRNSTAAQEQIELIGAKIQTVTRYIDNIVPYVPVGCTATAEQLAVSLE